MIAIFHIEQTFVNVHALVVHGIKHVSIVALTTVIAQGVMAYLVTGSVVHEAFVYVVAIVLICREVIPTETSTCEGALRIDTDLSTIISVLQTFIRIYTNLGFNVVTIANQTHYSIRSIG